MNQFKLKVNISYRKIGSHNIIAITGEVNLYQEIELRQIILDKIAETEHSLIIDMKDAAWIHRDAIGAFIAGKRQMKAKEGKFALLNVPEEMLAFLKLATLDDFFTIYKSESDIPE